MKRKNLIDALNFRLNSIIEVEEKKKETLVEMHNEVRKLLYYEIACFTHFIREDGLLNSLFTELIDYKKNLKKLDKYSDTLKLFYSKIELTAKEMLNNELFPEFEKSDSENKWLNPFHDSLTLKIRDLLDRLSNTDNEINKNGKIVSNNEILEIFVQIFTSWSFYSKYGLEKISGNINSLHETLNNLNYYDKFQQDYLGVNAAINLQRIYKAINPLTFSKNLDEIIIKSSVDSGETLFFAENLISDCKKVKHYLEQQLMTDYSLNLTIEKFKVFLELYYEVDTKKLNEKILQKEFELFLFNNGYYPISEAQLNNGRIDTIAVNCNSSFLCEYKQVGFGTTKITKNTPLEKLISSKIQADIYQKRLSGLPNLKSTVYVILFSSVYIIFMDDISEIKQKEINFKFKVIYLGKTPPSKIKNPRVIDLKELIN